MTTNLALFMFVHITATLGAFTEAPTSQKLAVGDQAVFRCQYSSADIIRWRLNSSFVRRNPPQDIVLRTEQDSSGILVDILIIEVREEYNGTEVVCVAQFDSGSPDEETQPAVLLVLLNSTDNGGFVMIPKSRNVSEETVVQFQCLHTAAAGIIWKVNRTDLQGSTPGVVTGRMENGVYFLNITGFPMYNLTMVQCEAFIRNSPAEETDPAMMTVQGNLSSVSGLEKRNSTLTWNSPTSLDLTGVDPDIIYCVDIYNVTCDLRDIVISDCNVTETSYVFDVLLPDEYLYEYIVIARSNVKNARNGTSSKPLRDQFPTFVMNSTLLLMKDVDTRYYQTVFTFKGMDQTVPSFFALALDPIDGLGDSFKVQTHTERNGNFLTLNVVPYLPAKRLWDCTVLAYGCQSHHVLSSAELSTHDIQNISVTSPQPGEIRVTGDFMDGSTATGVLVVISTGSMIEYHLISRRSGHLQLEGSISGLVGGLYDNSIFTLEEDGLPFERVAIRPKRRFVHTGGEEELPPLIEYSLQSTTTGVCINCTFFDSSVTDCVAIVHTQVSQTSMNGLIIKSSRKFSRSGDTASGCIERDNLEDYQVGVIGGREVQDMPQPRSNVCFGCITGSVLALTFFVTFAVVIMVPIVLSCRTLLRKKSQRITSTEDSAMEQGSDGHKNMNIYVTVSTSMEKLEDTTPLSVEADSPANNAQISDIPPDSDDHTPLMLIPHAATEADGKLPYAELAHFTKKTINIDPSSDDRTQYANVDNFQNQQGQKYAMVSHSCTNQRILDNPHKTSSGYSVIVHQQNSKVEKNETEKQCVPPPPPTRCTIESISCLLHPISPKWREFGIAVSLDEDHIDEIYTNNDTDEECFPVVLERYKVNGDFKHDWEEIVGILRKIGEESLADKVQDLHIHSCEGSVQGQTQQPSQAENSVSVESEETNSDNLKSTTQQCADTQDQIGVIDKDSIQDKQCENLTRSHSDSTSSSEDIDAGSSLSESDEPPSNSTKSSEVEDEGYFDGSNGTERQYVGAESEHNMIYPHGDITSCSEGSATENVDSECGELQSDSSHILESKAPIQQQSTDHEQQTLVQVHASSLQPTLVQKSTSMVTVLTEKQVPGCLPQQPCQDSEHDTSIVFIPGTSTVLPQGANEDDCRLHLVQDKHHEPCLPTVLKAFKATAHQEIQPLPCVAEMGSNHTELVVPSPFTYLDLSKEYRYGLLHFSRNSGDDSLQNTVMNYSETNEPSGVKVSPVKLMNKQHRRHKCVLRPRVKERS